MTLIHTPTGRKGELAQKYVKDGVTTILMCDLEKLVMVEAPEKEFKEAGK